MKPTGIDFGCSAAPPHHADEGRHLRRFSGSSKAWIGCLYSWQAGNTSGRAPGQQVSILFGLILGPVVSRTNGRPFAPIIGDAVNNLRESPEYWIHAALIAVGKPTKAYFPFCDEWKRLETSFNYSLLKKAFPGLVDFILNQVKPCRDTNLHLWAATSLCNQNKHNDFVPTVTVANIKNINAIIDGNFFKDCSMEGDADRPLCLIRASKPFTVDQISARPLN